MGSLLTHRLPSRVHCGMLGAQAQGQRRAPILKRTYRLPSRVHGGMLVAQSQRCAPVLERSRNPLSSTSHFPRIPLTVRPALTFTVHRDEPVLVTPAVPTPHELKPLSDIDDQDGNRYNGHAVNFYPAHPSNSDLDPATVIREALAKTLVFFYPLAGRLTELPGRKLVVQCTAEGALFVSATADVSLADFGPNPRPPFPCMDELIHEPEGTGGMINTPLVLIQVTRLKCGGFVLALRLNHAVCDAKGAVGFLHALGEVARGSASPRVLPVWERQLFSARDPPQITRLHPEYEEEVARHDRAEVAAVEAQTEEEQLQYKSFFFGPAEIAALKAQMPPELRSASKFDLVTAAVWRSRTAALRIQEGEVRVMFCASARKKRRLPKGYYGNSFGITVARATAEELHSNSLSCVVELVRKAKAAVTEEHIQSVADLMVLRGRPHFAVANTFVVSDVSRAGFEEVDMGWGKGVYGGPAKGGAVPRGSSFYLRHCNNKGEEGLLVPMCLPRPAMERFEAMVKSLVTLPLFDDILKLQATANNVHISDHNKIFDVVPCI